MATVTDGSLMMMAQEVVTDFIDGKASLNEGISKKASENGLNTDQTQRLIERANTEAFLRKFPETSEFEVASPEVILGVKVASEKTLSKVANIDSTDEGLFKAASENKETTIAPSVQRWNEKVASISEEDIFGMDDAFRKEEAEGKLESAIDLESKEWMKSLSAITKTASEIARENAAKEIAFGEKLEDFAEFVKQASLSDRQSIQDSEAELLAAFPDNCDLVRGIYTEIVNNMNEERVAPVKLARAQNVTPVQFYAETELTNKFQDILNVFND